MTGLNDDAGVSEPPVRPTLTYAGTQSPGAANSPAVKHAATEGLVKRLNNGFLVTLCVGFLGAVAGAFGGALATGIGFGLPLVALGGFIAWGLSERFQSREDTRQKFADSCYFLVSCSPCSR